MVMSTAQPSQAAQSGELLSEGERAMETERCHCGSPMRGSDHCPECGCEQYERTCSHQWTRENCEQCWWHGCCREHTRVGVQS